MIQDTIRNRTGLIRTDGPMNKTHLPRFSYFPFGGGIRGCIGESFAWMEGILLIATLSRKWEMRKVPSQRVKLDPAITLRPKYGMKMKLKLRT